MILLVLLVNIAIMTSETRGGLRRGTYMQSLYFTSIEAFCPLIYCVEFTARWLRVPSEIQLWKSISTCVSIWARIAATPKLGGVAIDTDTRPTDAFMCNLRILRVVRLIVLPHAFMGTKVLLCRRSWCIVALLVELS
ncbi:hypothetical protein PF005_g20855 [Phytophthora fragariae]|uniref:Ion transport domain-containing protein n=1 Tax=Phytophthora fragariae TaxID=53985 RepID=A0A6A3QZK2_9STRA|nr:hypothetical protein PF003_g15719 [Phytophthora fragariae]KAE8927998.1 hypothetical protein PF009_g21844 [Phytophthora fragariae]KAE8987108.1 hypothetical protein PF011_g19706 [Phytophthora fragariae]KAE9085883.1 hypothetical protein PF010_g20298 [Phytophthora fragariae]KAE9086037.1 hypothetical protein PF007_g20922 [Phytophthora fragariae]